MTTSPPMRPVVVGSVANSVVAATAPTLAELQLFFGLGGFLGLLYYLLFLAKWQFFILFYIFMSAERLKMLIFKLSNCFLNLKFFIEILESKFLTNISFIYFFVYFSSKLSSQNTGDYASIYLINVSIVRRQHDYGRARRRITDRRPRQVSVFPPKARDSIWIWTRFVRIWVSSQVGHI